MYDVNAPGNDSGIIIYRVNNLYSGAGNASGPPDELYVYRIGGTTTSNGSFGGAVFSEEVGQIEFNDTTKKVRVTDSLGKVWWVEPSQVSSSFL